MAGRWSYRTLMTHTKVVPIEYAQLDSVVIEGIPWFATADILRILGLELSTTIYNQLDPAEIGYAATLTSQRQSRGASIVSESGVYALISLSAHPDAAKFRRWITTDFLPAIHANLLRPVRDIMGGCAIESEFRTVGVAKAAEMFGVSPQWYGDQLRSRKLPGHKIAGRWRLTESDLKETLERTAKPAIVLVDPVSARPGTRRRHNRGRFKR